jgi:choline dehydrogenase-like flavoprotein
LNQLVDGTVLEADLCIIGAGVAGLLIAREFAGSSARIVLLEAGGTVADETSEELSGGEASARSFRGFQAGRARVFGGTSTLWGGQCIPLDAIDFEARPWIDHSGWPLRPDDLAPWYNRAAELLGTGDAGFDMPAWREFGLAPVPFHPDRLSSVQGVFIKQPDLGERFGAELDRAANIRVVLNANVERIDAGPDGRSVRRVLARDPGGRRCQVKTGRVVVCAGGIENARLLLLSDQPDPNGLGNAHGLVGCFFQDHICGRAAVIETDNPRFIQDHWNMLYGRRANYLPKIALSEAAQRREKTLGCVARLEYQYPEGSGMQALRDLARAVRESRNPALLARGAGILRDAASIADAGWRYAVRGLSPSAKPSDIFLEVFSEQAPRRENRVCLGRGLDRLGQRRPMIEWHISDLDRHTMSVFGRTVREEFARLGLARLRLAGWIDDETEPLPPEVVDSFHHAGTTRMSVDPSQGVVDSNGKVWGVDGLYIAGSSVFPTSGVANPTFTIAALALRLATEVAGQIRTGR